MTFFHFVEARWYGIVSPTHVSFQPWKTGFFVHNRPYALTSRLHNNDAMLGVKTCRAARTCFAGRAHWRSPSQSVCAPGPARRWGMQGFALWVHAWRWCTWRASFDPQHHGGALLWRHMHMVYTQKLVSLLNWMRGDLWPWTWQLFFFFQIWGRPTRKRRALLGRFLVGLLSKLTSLNVHNIWF